MLDLDSAAPVTTANADYLLPPHRLADAHNATHSISQLPAHVASFEHPSLEYLSSQISHMPVAPVTGLINIEPSHQSAPLTLTVAPKIGPLPDGRVYLLNNAVFEPKHEEQFTPQALLRSLATVLGAFAHTC